MEDFKDFSKNHKDKTQPQNAFDLIKALAQKYDGKSTDDLLLAIFKEAEKGKRQGTLSNADIDNFALTISPFLDDKKRKYLNKIVSELKKI
jgi:hypothetical protein